MNSVLKLAVILLGIFLVASCSKDKDEPKVYEGKNYAYLSFEDGTKRHQVSSKSKEAISLVLRLTKATSRDLTFKLNLSERMQELFKFDKAEILMPKGSFEAKFSLMPNLPKSFTEEGVVLSIALAELPKGIVLSAEKEVQFELMPKPKKVLSERDEVLLKSYETKFGLDLRPFLGEMECNGTIAWAGFEYDYPNIAAPEEVKIIKQMMAVSLSEKATEDKIILEFKQNALGLNAFFSKIWNNYTILDEQAWNHPDPTITPPNNKKIREKIKWTKATAKNETFETYLDNVRIDPKTGKIDFLGRRGSAVKEKQKDYPYADERRERMVVVPFFYKLSVIERMIKAAKEDKEFVQIIEGSDTNIYQILSDTAVDKDGLVDEGFPETKYVEPKASIDFKKGTMTFVFPQHIYNSISYTVFRIECRIAE